MNQSKSITRHGSNLVVMTFATAFGFLLLLAALFLGGKFWGMTSNDREIFDFSLRWLSILSFLAGIYFLLAAGRHLAPLAAASLLSASTVGAVFFYDACAYYVAGVFIGLISMFFLASQLEDSQTSWKKVFGALLTTIILQSGLSYLLIRLVG